MRARPDGPRWWLSRLSISFWNTVCVVSWGQIKSRVVAAELACGVAAGPLFVSTFTAIGAKRSGYDWRRHAVSSLADGRGGWLQRANFIVTGSLLLHRRTRPRARPEADRGSARGPSTDVRGRRWTDRLWTVRDRPRGRVPAVAERSGPGGSHTRGHPTREGTLHNLCATPIFVGIPIAAMTCATSAAHRGHYRWASYSAGSAIAMGSATALFGAAFGGAPRLARHGGAPAAPVDRNRVRMAERTIASRVDFSPPRLLGLGRRSRGRGYRLLRGRRAFPRPESDAGGIPLERRATESRCAGGSAEAVALLTTIGSLRYHLYRWWRASL